MQGSLEYMDTWLGKAVTEQCNEPMEEQLDVFWRVNHEDCWIDSDKYAHVQKVSDYGIKRLLSEIQKGSHHDTPYFSISVGILPLAKARWHIHKVFEV